MAPLWRRRRPASTNPPKENRPGRRIGLDAARRLMHNQMVLKLSGYEMTESDRLDAVFMALADPTRRAILARLATGEVSVTELAEPFEMSQPAISKHLKVLERAGLISVDVDAQRRPRKLEPKRLEEAVDWIERYREIFEQNYQRLDALLEELQAKPSKRRRTQK